MPQERLTGVLPLSAFFLPLVFLAGLAIYARRKKPQWYFWTKPLPVLWILLWCAFWIFSDSKSLPFPSWLILAGLILGLGGDIFLLKKEYFLAGYLCFAAGHLAYISGFFLQSHFVLSWMEILPFCLMGAAYALFVSRVTSQKSKVPLVLAYAAIITLMLLGALNVLLATGLGSRTGDLLFSGALLFCISDGLWSYNNFVRPLAWPGLGILSTYYAAQAMIALASFY